ncbi:MAG: hypothetical protein Kow0062_01810 [Acidobacteriota bacterium]
MLGLLRWRGRATVTVWKLPDRIVISREERTARGIALAVEPTLVVPRGAPPERLGAVLRRALAGPERRQPEPRSWDRAHDRLVEAAGVSSHRWLLQSGLLVRVRREGRRVTLVPTVNLGHRGPERGFRSLPDNGIEVSVRLDDTALGAALAEALGRATRESGRTGRTGTGALAFDPDAQD